MNLEQRFNLQLAAHIEASTAAAALAQPMAMAAQCLVNTLLNGGKAIACGNGGGAALARHFASLMTHHCGRERPGLPAIALHTSADGPNPLLDEGGLSQVLARQLNALGHPGDILLAISANGREDNILQAIEAAIGRQMQILVLSGCDGGSVPSLLREQDIEIRVPHEQGVRIQEIQLLLLHCLCDLIDTQLLGS